jgi:hypothetical protein
MRKIPAEEAFRMLAEWSQDRAEIRVVLSGPVPQRAASVAVLDQLLPNSQRARLTLQDENGEDVAVTLSLEGAEWEYNDPGAVLPEFADWKAVRSLRATFGTGNRYVFSARPGGA